MLCFLEGDHMYVVSSAYAACDPASLSHYTLFITSPPSAPLVLQFLGTSFCSQPRAPVPCSSWHLRGSAAASPGLTVYPVEQLAAGSGLPQDPHFKSLFIFSSDFFECFWLKEKFWNSLRKKKSSLDMHLWSFVFGWFSNVTLFHLPFSPFLEGCVCLHAMDHTLFGCLRSPHVPAQALHPAFTQSPLTLHGRSDHVSYPDLASSSSSSSTSSPSPCIISSYPTDDSLFPGQHHLPHRGHLPSQQHHHPPQHHASWHIPQMPSPGSGTRHNLCHPPSHPSHNGPTPPDLGHPGGPIMCASTPSLGGSNTPTGASCVPADFGRQTLSPAEAEKRNGKRKSDSSGKRTQVEK